MKENNNTIELGLPSKGKGRFNLERIETILKRNNNNERVVIFDETNEYKYLCDKFKGTYLNSPFEFWDVAKSSKLVVINVEKSNKKTRDEIIKIGEYIENVEYLENNEVLLVNNIGMIPFKNKHVKKALKEAKKGLKNG